MKLGLVATGIVWFLWVSYAIRTLYCVGDIKKAEEKNENILEQFVMRLTVWVALGT